MAFVEIDALEVRYGATRVVHDFSLRVEAGEFVALLGPSGCGKTTILRAVSGLLTPTAGSLRIGGEDVGSLPVHRRNIGYVFQNYALFPHLSVRKNVAFGLDVRGAARAESERRVAEALDLVRLSGFAERRPRQLSGGQQQRVALARALVIAPRLLLLDECLSNLDAKLREELRGEIREIQKRTGITTLFVTHDQTEALTMCDRIAVLDQGRVSQEGAPEAIYDRPNSPFVARFIGRINEIVGVAGGDGMALAGSVRIKLPQPFPPGGRILLMIRPHRVAVGGPEAAAVGDDRQALAGVVARKSFLGNTMEVEVRTDAGALIAETNAGAADWGALKPGSPVVLSWDIQDSLVFPDDRAAA